MIGTGIAPDERRSTDRRASTIWEGGVMVTWSAFAEAAPEIAGIGRRVLERTGTGAALLATVRGDGLPRIHPIDVAIVDGRLVAFLIIGSSKLTDLEVDGRYALHGHQDPTRPDEFLIRGHATEVADPIMRAASAAAWSFAVDDGYRLFEFSIEQATLGQRQDADAWPPRYTAWRAPRPGG